MLRLYLRRSLPVIDGTASGRRALGADRDHSRRRRDPARLRVDQGATRCSASATCTRRIGCGRWSSSGGSATAGCRRSSAPPTIPQDRFLRTVGFGRAARAAWAATPAWAKEQINAYVAGVNAFIADPSRQPAAAGVLAAALRARALERRRRHRLGEDDGLGPERELLVRAAAPRSRRGPSAQKRMAQLMPPYPRDGLSASCRTAAAAGESGTSGGARTRQPPNRVRRAGRLRAAWPPCQRGSRRRLSTGEPASTTSCWAARRRRSARTTGSSTAR